MRLLRILSLNWHHTYPIRNISTYRYQVGTWLLAVSAQLCIANRLIAAASWDRKQSNEAIYIHSWARKSVYDAFRERGIAGYRRYTIYLRCNVFCRSRRTLSGNQSVPTGKIVPRFSASLSVLGFIVNSTSLPVGWAPGGGDRREVQSKFWSLRLYAAFVMWPSERAVD